MEIGKISIPLNDKTRLPWRVIAISLLIISSFIFTKSVIDIIRFQNRFVDIPTNKEITTLILLDKNHVFEKILKELPNKNGVSIHSDSPTRNKILYLNGFGEAIAYKNSAGEIVDLTSTPLETEKMRLPLLKKASFYLIYNNGIYKGSSSKNEISIQLKETLNISRKTAEAGELVVNHEIETGNSFIQSIKNIYINNSLDIIKLSGLLKDEANTSILSLIEAIPSNLYINTENGYREVMSQNETSTNSTNVYSSTRKGDASLIVSNNTFTLSTKDLLNNLSRIDEEDACLRGKYSSIRADDDLIEALSVKRHSFVEKLLNETSFITLDKNSINICLSVDNLWKTH